MAQPLHKGQTPRAIPIDQAHRIAPRSKAEGLIANHTIDGRPDLGLQTAQRAARPAVHRRVKHAISDTRRQIIAPDRIPILAPVNPGHLSVGESYGKSIRRDKLEGDVGDILRQLEPNPSLFAIVKAMFRDAWDIRGAQLAQEAKPYEKQIADIQKQIDVLLDRIVEADNATVIKAYEKKIVSLEKEKIIL